MGLREGTGYVAHAVLLGYWLWVVAATTPQLRKGTRGQTVRVRVLVIKTAGFAFTAVFVGIVHYWATAWWQVAVALPAAAVLGLLLRRAYRRSVAAPRHRLTLAQRVRTLDLHVHPQHSGAPQHLRGDRAVPTASPRPAD